jgi:hypothetical protein
MTSTEPSGGQLAGSRRRQGLPPKVEDPIVLDQVALLVAALLVGDPEVEGGDADALSA